MACNVTIQRDLEVVYTYGLLSGDSIDGESGGLRAWTTFCGMRYTMKTTEGTAIN